MNSKEIEQAILNKLQSGEKMEDILEEIAATANKINAQRVAEAATEKKYELIRKGPNEYLKQLQWDETAVTEDILGEIIAAYLLGHKDIAATCKNTEDIKELVHVCQKHLESLPFLISAAKKAADLFIENFSASAEKSIHISGPAEKSPKIVGKDDFDIIEHFLKDNGLL